MSDATEAAESQKPDIIDIEQPEKVKPSSTSKPVIVSNQPVLKDPMVVDEDTSDGEQPSAADAETAESEKKLSHAEAPTLRPLSEPAPDDDAAKDADEKRPETDVPEPASDKEQSKKPAKKPPPAAPDQDAEPSADVQKLVESGEYILPISSSEERRNKRFVLAGVAVAVILVVAWLDIALDAHIITLGGLHPATHFFSN